MRTDFKIALFLLLTLALGCNMPTNKDVASRAKLTETDLITRGKYLTTIGGCNDCHSPKVIAPGGIEPDTTRLMSGHPQDEILNPIIKTQDWLVFNNNFTAFVGPWGISYAANLTPDDTGIRHWKFEQFETAIRKGKSKGLINNRSLLPPMPWQMYQHLTDDDLRAVFTYLKSLPPVNNLVPAPVSPEKI